MKNQALSQYLGSNMTQLAMKDEQNYIKAVQEQEQKNARKDEEEARKQLRTKSFNMEGLNF